MKLENKHVAAIAVAALLIAIVGVVTVVGAAGDGLEDDHIWLGSANDIAVQEEIEDCQGTGNHKLQYNQTTNAFECDTTAPGSTITTQSDDSTVSASSTILDFRTYFSLSESPAGETNITLSMTEAELETAVTDASDIFTNNDGALDDDDVTDDSIGSLSDVVSAGESGGDILVWDGVDSYDNQTVGGDGTLSAAGALEVTEADALESDPADCGANEFATAINTTADLTCSQPDHGNLAGLGDDDHSIYALLAGRSGGQTLTGGTGAGDDLTLKTTSNVSKGSYIFSELDCSGNSNGGALTATSTGEVICTDDDSGGGGGSAVTLDLADDGTDESTDLQEIATTGDTNSIFTEPTADKLLIDLGLNWPTADAADALSANGTNCSAGQYARGVDASGNAENCTADDDIPEAGDYTNLTGGDGIDHSVTGTIAVDLMSATTTSATTDSNSGLEFVGGEASLLRGCSEGQALQFSTALFVWACANNEAFRSIGTDSGTAPVADTSSDTLTFNGGTGITTTGASGTDEVTIDVDESASLTWTGAHDFGGGTSLEVPNGANPTVDADGETAMDTTADQVVFQPSATTTDFVLDAHREKTITLESATSTDNILLGKWQAYGIQVTSIDCIVDPADTGDSAEVTIQERDSAGDNPASVNDSAISCDNDGATNGAVSNATIDQGDWWSIDIGTVSGTVDQLSVTVTYIIVRQ